MFKRKLIFSFFTVFLVLFGTAVFIKNKYVVPIIMYHSVPLEAGNNRLAVSAKTFDRQMQFLKKHRYNIVTIDELADLIRSKRSLPPKTVAITFDDGYKNNYTYAFPVLKKYGIKATVFIIIQEIARPENDRLNWEEIMEMKESGLILFGSHAIGPEPLVKIEPDAEVKRQIFESKAILEEKLQEKVGVFSYPEGMFNQKIRQLAMDAGYKAVVATNPGRNYPDDDVFALKRIRISENAANLFVFWVETSGFYTFMKEHRHK